MAGFTDVTKPFDIEVEYNSLLRSRGHYLYDFSVGTNLFFLGDARDALNVLIN